MSYNMTYGTVWPAARKPIEVGAQPCTDVWRQETSYADSAVLIHNWYDTRAQQQYDRTQRKAEYMQTYLGQKPSAAVKPRMSDQSEYTASYTHPKGRQLPSCYKSVEIHRNMLTPQEVFMRVYEKRADLVPASDVQPECGASTSNSKKSGGSNLVKLRLPLQTIYHKNIACETRPRGQYKLLEQALQDRTCGTEANNYVSSLFPESKTAQSDQPIAAQSHDQQPIRTCVNKMVNLCRDVYPVSYNKRVKWVEPKNKTFCHTTCQ